MDRVLHLPADVPRSDRPAGFDDDICFSPRLVELVLAEFTREGDAVFDPFTGFGTTLVVSERMGRHPLGLELLEERVAFVRRKLAHPESLVVGDARRLAEYDLPELDFSLTSPPYMNKVDHPENPLNGYRTLDGDYDRYLLELGQVYRQLADRLKPGAHAVINAANIRTGNTVTTLAWDVAAAVSEYLTFTGEIVIEWAEHPEWLTGDYLLVFQRS